MQLAKRAEPSAAASTVKLLAALGRQFAAAPPPSHLRLPVLNEVWRVATRCTDLDDYVACATAWLDCILKHYSDREVKVLLADVLRHVDDAARRRRGRPNQIAFKMPPGAFLNIPATL